MQIPDETTTAEVTRLVQGDDISGSEEHSSHSGSEDRKDRSTSNALECHHLSQIVSGLVQSSSSIDVDDFLGSAVATPPSITFKIVGHNIDKEVKPQDMRSNYQTRPLHYFHFYAVRDRVNMDNVYNILCAPDITAVDLELLFPTRQDEAISVAKCQFSLVAL